MGRMSGCSRKRLKPGCSAERAASSAGSLTNSLGTTRDCSDQFGQDPGLCQTRRAPGDRARRSRERRGRHGKRRIPTDPGTSRQRAPDPTAEGRNHSWESKSFASSCKAALSCSRASRCLPWRQDPCEFFVRSGGLFHLPQGGLAVLPGLVRFFLKLQVVGKLVVGIDGLLDIFPDPAVFAERVVQLPDGLIRRPQAVVRVLVAGINRHGGLVLPDRLAVMVGLGQRQSRDCNRPRCSGTSCRGPRGFRCRAKSPSAARRRRPRRR